jgi:hypothetical protein
MRENKLASFRKNTTFFRPTPFLSGNRGDYTPWQPGVENKRQRRFAAIYEMTSYKSPN